MIIFSTHLEFLSTVLNIYKNMKLYIKWFYWYKNFWDEVIVFGLLNFLQKEYNPESFTLEVGDSGWIKERINNNKKYLDYWILDKLDFVENSVISKRFRQLKTVLWIDKYRKHFKVFGGWEVLDESRKTPHDWVNLAILYNIDIKKWNFILAWWIGTHEKQTTKALYKHILPKAKKLVFRDDISVQRAKKYKDENVLQVDDFSKCVFTKNQISSYTKSVLLINVSPNYFNDENLEKIKEYSKKHPSHKKIYFPADINFDKEFYSKIRKYVPDLEIYDWTKHSLDDTISLFSSCCCWIGSRLHFLYPLKFFNKKFMSISDSDKVKKMI